ncbi:hypothetical protein ABT187_42250 [Streptomyces sp. NPDC001817]|uniref:hypothetical protein n=1 Tax=Streptomyces sp. NPDC001817 TaxID=3154398 RepID=UPI0033255946
MPSWERGFRVPSHGPLVAGLDTGGLTDVRLDAEARRVVDWAAADGTLQVISHEPPEQHEESLAFMPQPLTQASAGGPCLFWEVSVRDSSDFTADVTVHGTERDGAAQLRVQGPTFPNTIAAILLALRDRTGEVPHVYLSWSEGGPVSRLLRFLAFGDGEVATVTREVLRRAEPDPERRPRVHVS